MVKIRFQILSKLKAINVLYRHQDDGSKENYSKEHEIFALGEPLTKNSKYKPRFTEMKKFGYWYVGICSYEDFPESQHSDGKTFFDDKEQVENLVGWLYCQRDLDQSVMPKSLPKLRFSESDFCDKYKKTVNVSGKIYDFLYNCQKGKHQKKWRNWDFAVKCLEKMVYKFGLKVILIGKEGDDSTEEEQRLLFHQNVTITDFLPYEQMLRAVKQSRSVFVPSVLDASPRILSEALSLDVPIFLNKAIFGGWHYLNDQTGTGFTETGDFEATLKQHLLKVKKNRFKPKRWYLQHYGDEIASKRLDGFIRSLSKPLYLKDQSLAISGLVPLSRIDPLPDLQTNSYLKEISHKLGLPVCHSVQGHHQSSEIVEGNSYLFVTSGFKILHYDKFTHYVNLFFKFHQEASASLVLSSQDDGLLETSYLYLKKSNQFMNVSGVIAKGGFASVLSNQLVENKIGGYVLKPGIVEPDLVDGWLIKNQYLEESDLDLRLVDAWIYSDKINGDGLISWNKEGSWIEVKNGRDHCEFTEVLNENGITVLWENSKRLYIKLNLDQNSAGSKAYFKRQYNWNFMFDLAKAKNYLFRFEKGEIVFDQLNRYIEIESEQKGFEILEKSGDYLKIKDCDHVEYRVNQSSIEFKNHNHRGSWFS